MSKRKSARMGREFLLLMTLERALSLLLSAVLEIVNLMREYFIVMFLSVKLSTKIQNYLFKCKNILGKMLFLKIFSVISQSETKKSQKNNK
jgi:hypothetical protein